MVFSKVTQSLRCLVCRNREALWNFMQGVLDVVTASNAAEVVNHCGYTLRV